MKIRVGQILIARKTVHMQYNPVDICLKKNHRYKILGIEDDTFIINSEILKAHPWDTSEIDKFFITTLKMNKNIHIL